MNYKRSPIPYMGNKYKLLPQLLPLFPKKCDIFVDLFGGSGVVSMNYQGSKRTIYNEFNKNIVELVKMIVNSDPQKLDDYFKNKIKYYNLPTLSTNKEKSITRQKSYNKMREDYNKSTLKDYRDLFLLICYSINHLIRFNSRNEFNAPNGNNAYNQNNKLDIINMHKYMQNVELQSEDALSFDFSILTVDSFVYCDVPYLNTEAVYNEKRAFGGWTIESDYKIFDILEKLNANGVKWGLSNVFSNRGKTNQHLIDWCNKNNWNVYHLNRNYNPFSRGNSDSDEVYICNYGDKKILKQISLFD